MEAVASGGPFSSSFLGSTASAIGLLLLAVWSAMLMLGIRVERPMIKMAGIILTALGFSMLLGLYDDLGAPDDWQGGLLGHWVGERCENTGLASVSRVLLWLAVPAGMLVATEWLFLGYLLRGPKLLPASGRLAGILNRGAKFFGTVRQASPRQPPDIRSLHRAAGPALAEERGAEHPAAPPAAADPLVRPMRRGAAPEPPGPASWMSSAAELREPTVQTSVAELEPAEADRAEAEPSVPPPAGVIEGQVESAAALAPFGPQRPAEVPDIAEVVALELDLDLDPFDLPSRPARAKASSSGAWWKTEGVEPAQPRPTVAALVDDAEQPAALTPEAASPAAARPGPSRAEPAERGAPTAAEEPAPDAAVLPAAAAGGVPAPAARGEEAPAPEPAAAADAVAAALAPEPAGERASAVSGETAAVEAEPPVAGDLAAEAGKTAGLSDEEAVLLRKAVTVVMRENRASISLLQKDLGLGYFRAAKLLNTLEAHGVIAPYSGSSARKVVISEEEAEKVLAAASR